MKLRWPGWPDFLVNASAKTAGKRAVKFKTIVRRFAVESGATCRMDSVTITNGETHMIFVTVEQNFTKAAKKSTTEPPIALVGVLKRMADK